MKALLIIALLISSADASVFAYRQSASQSGNVPLAFPSNNVAGNMIVVATSNTAVSAVNDTAGNIYSLLSTQTSGPIQLQLWVAQNINSGANNVTATGLNASGSNSSIAIIEYTVPATYGVAAANGGFTINPVNGSNTQYMSPGETLLIIATYDFHSSHSWTGTNLTVRETTAEGGGQTMGIGDFDAATSTIATVSTLNTCSQANSCFTANLLNFAITGGSTATPSASAFVGLL